MTARLPYTKRERRAVAHPYGHRPTNDWGSGNLPAPWAQGDIIDVPEGSPALADGWDPGPFVVCYVTSIDEGDGWYVRLWLPADTYRVSDRLHIWHAARSTFGKDRDALAGCTLIDTADPDGLALRERMLADGGKPTLPARCPTCGAPTLWENP